MSGASSASQAAALAAFRAKKDPTQDDLSAKAPPKRPMPLRVNTDVCRQKSTSTTVILSTPLSAKPISGKSATAKLLAISVSKVGMKLPATKLPKSAGTKGALTEGSDGTRLQYSSSTASNISSIPRKNLIKLPTPLKPSLAGGAALFASMSVAPTVVPSISAVALAAGKTAAENMPQTPTHNEYLNSYNDRKQADPPSASSHNYTSSNFNSSSNINPTNPKSPHLNRSADASPRAQSGRTQPSSRRDSFTSNSDLESTYSKSSVVVALAAAAAALVSSLKPRSNVESKPRLSESTNRLSSYDPKEMIKQVKESINSKATKLKALSEELTQKNQALLEGLRKSIDLKRISRQIPSNLAFQSSDDVRRHSYQNSLNFPILSSTNVSSSAVSHDSAYGHGFGSIDNGDAPNGVFNQPYYNNSYSSLESATLVPSYAHSGTPVIVVGPQLPDVGGITGTFDTSLRSSAEDLSKDEPPKQRKGVISADSPPIQVPASSLVVARSQSAGSSETLPHPMHRIPLQRTISNNKSLTIPDEAGKSKLKRKPPPGNYEHPLTPKDEDFGFETDFKKPGMLSPQSGYLLSKSLLANTDEFEYSTDQDGDAGTQEEHDQDDRSTRDPDFAPLAARNNKLLPQSNSLGKFPQFPDIDARRSGQDHSLFKRKHKAKGSVSASNFGLDFEDEGEYSDDDIQEEGPGSSSAASLAVPMVPSGANSGGSSGGGSGSATPARPLTPVLPQKTQTVRMKTTMRKTNKRKDKKLLFNENKPWKNHNELNYITEQERKRYEGVWVSNRGSYINCVVTGLVGVDYDQINNPPLEKEEEVEVPLKAALLSAQANKFDPKNVVDHQNFHNLKSAEVNQLMHGLVIKRLWMRSRLPSETLATIWNLVDFRLDGTLNKQEFLVGMWLVDQCLYGRKIPKKVDDTIWDSLGSIGVNVVIKKKGRR